MPSKHLAAGSIPAGCIYFLDKDKEMKIISKVTFENLQAIKNLSISFEFAPVAIINLLYGNEAVKELGTVHYIVVDIDENKSNLVDLFGIVSNIQTAIK